MMNVIMMSGIKLEYNLLLNADNETQFYNTDNN